MNEIFRDLRHEPTVGHAETRDTANREVTDAKIKEVILTFGCRVKAFDGRCGDNAEDESKWSTFPSQAQTTIREIEHDDSFEWERRFLDILINPDDVEEGWSEIALEPDIKEAIQQLIQQPTNTVMHSYGILKRGRIGGALLYGPPGTGKTHLARVLARESKAITICASAADLVGIYTGETEKAIQGLFNLGRMLSPCTIFLDEADALFRSRKSDDKSWERSQMNQLLHEMDGLKKSRSSPIVLLATNFPNDLDSAVLRRVPSRIHIGLPSSEALQQIFQIYLAEEMLHPDVNLCHLADRSQGYSGSDIQTVCIQAALICDTFIGNDTRRHIMNSHFDKAFQRSAPTVSKGALAKIKAFSKEYNPAALESKERIGKVILLTEHRVFDTRNVRLHVAMITCPGSTQTCFPLVEWKKSRVPIDKFLCSLIACRYASCLSYQRGVNPTAFWRCTLRTVDLNDWTTLYREFLSQADNCNAPKSPKFRLAMWYSSNSSRQGLRENSYSGAECSTKESESFWTGVLMDKAFAFEGNQEIDSRFNWGE